MILCKSNVVQGSSALHDSAPAGLLAAAATAALAALDGLGLEDGADGGGAWRHDIDLSRFKVVRFGFVGSLEVKLQG